MRAWSVVGFFVLFFAETSHAQFQRSSGIRGVTRPTITSPPIGIQGLVPLTNSAAASAVGSTAVAPPPRIVYRLETKDDPAEVDKRVLAFQQKRAEQGSPSAQLDLAKRYFVGKGVSQDFKHAEKLLRSAAIGGNSEAVKLLQKWEAVKAASSGE